MTQSITPPPLHGPTAKEKKYDRQLRLWAASGQAALESAHVLLLNSGSGTVGVEALKNLVLPGVGSFTIVDECNVQDEDLGVNFFVDEASLGQPRAKACCELLAELNPDVSGHWKKQTAAAWLKEAKVTDYTLIILTRALQVGSAEWEIAQQAWTHAIPLIYIRCAGFYSFFSVQLPSIFPIVDTHPDPASTQDLRLLKPWPALQEYAQHQTRSLDQMSDHDHGHVPYILLLLHYLDLWRREHGSYPISYKDKKAFRDTVANGARTENADGGEENFDEAVGAVLKSLNDPTIPSGIQQIFDSPDCKNLSLSSADFWVIAHAVNSFTREHGVLPLSGSLPDMKAQSKDYVALQKLYRDKAQADVNDVENRIRMVESQIGRKSLIPRREVEAFCKGAAFVRVLHGQALVVPNPQATQSQPDKPDQPGRKDEGLRFWSQVPQREIIVKELGDPESLMHIFVAFAAVDEVLSARDLSLANTLPDFAGLKSEVEAVVRMRLAQLGISTESAFSVSKDGDTDSSGAAAAAAVAAAESPYQQQTYRVAAELARSGGAELHNIAALTGGIVAQEAIKIITKQYVPVDNICVFDGIVSKTAVFHL